MRSDGAGSTIVDGLQLVGKVGGIACAELDGLHGGSIVLRTETHYEPFVFQVSGILLQHGGGVSRGDELHAAETALLQGVRRFLEIALEIGEIPLGVICQER